MMECGCRLPLLGRLLLLLHPKKRVVRLNENARRGKKNIAQAGTLGACHRAR